MNIEGLKQLIFEIPCGFRVSFERRENGMLKGDHYPERHEPLIPFEDIAWAWAERIAKINPSYIVNVYVVDHEFSPVPGYKKRQLNNYPTHTGAGL